MKLTVRANPAVGAVTGMAVILCDELGEPLPNQVEVRLTTGISDVPRITVDFVVDGHDIRIVE